MYNILVVYYKTYYNGGCNEMRIFSKWRMELLNTRIYIHIDCIKHVTNYVGKHVILYNVFFLLFFFPKNQ